METELKQYEMEVEVVRKMFYNQETMFGAFAIRPVEYNRELIYNQYNNVSLQGNTRFLKEWETYTIKFEGVYTHPKYGAYYKIISVEPEKLDTKDAQDKFLQSITSEDQFKSLRTAYPEGKLVDMILNDQIDVQKTKGIKEYTLNAIKKRIKENESLSLLMAATEKLDLSTNLITKIMEHYRDAHLAIEKIENDIYDLCNIYSLGFKTIDDIALKRGDSPTNIQRINACFNYVIKQSMNDGHSWISKNDLSEKAFKLLEIPQELISEKINELSKTDGFIVSDGRIALERAYNQELSIHMHLLRIQQHYTPPKVENLEKRVAEVEKEQGFKFTDEQRNAIIKGSQEGVMIVNGKAGTGKSTLVNGLIESLGSPNYITCALSGKAVDVLSQKGIEASTIHRMLGNDQKTGGFAHTANNPMPYDLVVVDESSMIDVYLFNSVIQAVKSGAKLIIVGDSGQLPAIGYGDVLRDLLDTQVFPTFELTQVHRQAAKSGILSLANDIRDGKQMFPYNSSGMETYGELKDQTVISYSKKDTIPNDIIKIASTYTDRIKQPSDLLDFQVIVPNREKGNLSVKNLNIGLQEVFNDLSKEAVSGYGYDYRIGDKVIQKGNAYSTFIYSNLDDYYKKTEEEMMLGDEYRHGRVADLFNGTMGYIVDIDTKVRDIETLIIKFEGINGLVKVEKNNLKRINMAYALTVHESQGSGIKHVIFALDFGAFTLLSKQLVYTALTRAIEKGVVLCENNAMHKAISTDASRSRRTFLADFIKSKQ